MLLKPACTASKSGARTPNSTPLRRSNSRAGPAVSGLMRVCLISASSNFETPSRLKRSISKSLFTLQIPNFRTLCRSSFSSKFHTFKLQSVKCSLSFQALHNSKSEKRTRDTYEKGVLGCMQIEHVDLQRASKATARQKRAATAVIKWPFL